MRTPQTRSSDARPPVAEEQRRRWFARPGLQLAAAVTALALIGGGWYLSRGARDVTVDSAVDEFRKGGEAEKDAKARVGSSATAEPSGAANEDAPAAREAATPDEPAAPAAPASAPRTAYTPAPQGVYVYATEGYEETDALAGARHDYPKETTITNRKGGCGWTTRWQPLEERWEESELCETPQGTRMGRYSMYHEFFRRGVRDDFKCDGFVQKLGARAGDSWSMVCKSPDSSAKSVNSVIGMETISVDGKALKALHMRYDIKVSGANTGRLVQDRWFSDEPRALLRMTQKANLDANSPFGKVAYRESVRIDLKSLEPRT